MLADELPLWSEVFPGFRPEHIESMTIREVVYYQRRLRVVLAQREAEQRAHRP